MKFVEEDYDVVVAGGGLAGFSAAVAAARHGAKTVLIQDRPVLGGNSSSEVRVTPHGAAAFHGYARETGIISEALIQERATNHAKIEENGWTNSVWDLVLYDMAVRTEGLTLHLNTALEEVDVIDHRISRVRARVANAETVIQISGKTFIDCTGDGTLGALAGAEWLSGTEAASEYGEPDAPDEASDGTMGSSLHFKTVDTGRPVPFKAPEWAVKYDDPSFFRKGARLPKTLSSGYWWIEIGTPWDSIHDNEVIRHELTRHVLGIWDYLKNRDPHWSEKAANLALDWIGQVPGKRESRRLLGELVLTENHLIENGSFEDEVAFGGWYVDLHTLGGLLAEDAEPVSTALFANPKSSFGSSKYVGPFGIPLRALMSKDVSNLMFAGRNVSSTHAALGALRVMGTTAVMGQAAGTAAAIAKDGQGIQSVLTTNMGELQQALLRDGCFLPHVRNTDPADLALASSVTSSSADKVRGVGPNSANWLGGIDHWRDHPVHPFTGRLERRTAQWIAVGAGQGVDVIRLALSNGGESAREVTATVHKVKDIWDYRTEPGGALRKEVLIVPPGGPHWIEWPVTIPGDDLAEGGYIRVDLEAAPEIEWHVSSTVLPGQIAGYEYSPGRYRRFGGGSTLSFQIEPAQEAYTADNVLTGVTRPHQGTNQWRSDPVAPLPQWLELSWQEPQRIRQVQITFSGHLLREYHAYPAFYRDPQCARDYALEAETAGGWREITRVSGNYSTRVVHDLPEGITTGRLRLTVFATNGDPSAGVYEIRCYQSPICTSAG
ncbi:FAD-dependent oxidoreductase [Pseudarthrobacter sp. NCCP-2145]|uniref:FAD-dependent oxidoreductase n=1 Tax=Pseudarthrobacter sp. NCCP-2145 TaxID=2942290 RepID=UPI002040FFE5|nr:FAD-dependent oxidoreductase [Pseudarthrobacter sp. NCCP-2145]GKV71929.1 hypothetical protein NCCP2145_13100 [Pseudarthrobacter sp. NCCP-2145]